MKSHAEIERMLQALDAVVSGEISTPLTTLQLRMCEILRTTIAATVDKSRDEIVFACNWHCAIANGDAPERQRAVHRLHHAALCWVLNDAAGGDFVPQLFEDLLSLFDEWVAYQAKGSGDARTSRGARAGQPVLVAAH